jgi:deferrochelatase/peroxidase EfeB
MPLDLSDIQANVLRGYGAAFARHFALALPTAAAGAALLGALINGDGECPQVSDAKVWSDKPSYCLNVGITADGLGALGVPAATVGAFPAAFRSGSAARSSLPTTGPDDVGLGDVGDSAPAAWILGGTASPTVHLLISLYTHHEKALETRSAQLRTVFGATGVHELSSHDAVAQPGGTVHFGYRDGIAQPWIDGTPGQRLDDVQPSVPTGDFLLGSGYTNRYKGNFIGAIPRTLGDNGTYSAFRLLRQDVTGFEEFLAKAAARWRQDPEVIAAKLMGRWRNGAPLALSPDGPNPTPPITEAQINAYDFVATPEHPAFHDDDFGARCPIGAHTRRLNPRGALVMGQPNSRRIIRRGMPYGPPFDPDHPDDVERGLVGHFICGDIESQFEFIMKGWVNQDIQTAGLRGTRDPILGAQPEHGGRFVISLGPNRDPMILDNLPRLVHTRGSLYLFLPGIGALRRLAAVTTEEAS